jgi:eukaryotic-like serine/threonine-protein kinase
MIGQDIGKYRVLERIGRGGMGTVYRAIDETLKRDVAIKVLNAELNDPSVARRFRAEAVTVARLSHPGIATIYELFEYDGQWLMVMEFVRGETLEALLARKGPLAANESAELCMQALGALAHAHSLGVVHRDLKPANMMVAESGAVKIMDFGIARVVGTEHLTSAGFMMGTPAYMAPEQVRGEEIDARADLYAIGVVLYHLVTAALPFKGNTPFEMAQSRLRDQPTPVRSVRADLPPWLGQVLGFALEPDLLRRFQSAALFRDALRRGLAGLPLETPDTRTVPPELVATAAPGSMPVPVAPVGVPVTPVPTAASSATSRPPEPVAAVPSALEAPSAPAPTTVGKRDTRPTRVAIGALLGLVLVTLGWMALR